MPVELTDPPLPVLRPAGPAPDVVRWDGPPPAVPRARPGLGPIGRRCHELVAADDAPTLRALVDQLADDGLSTIAILQELLLPAVDALPTGRQARGFALVEEVLDHRRPGREGRGRRILLLDRPPIDGRDHTGTTAGAAIALRHEGWEVPPVHHLSPAALEAFCDERRVDLVVIVGRPADEVAETLDRFATRPERLAVVDADITLYALLDLARSGA